MTNARPWRPKYSAPRGELCPPFSSTRLPGGGLGRQCVRRVHGAGGLRSGLCRPSEALAAAPPSSFTFSALTHRPPTRAWRGSAAVPRGEDGSDRRRPGGRGRGEGPTRPAGTREQGAPRPRRAGSAAPTAAPPRARAPLPSARLPARPRRRPSAPGRGAHSAVGTGSLASLPGGW